MITRFILAFCCACYFPLMAQQQFEPYTHKEGLPSLEVTVTFVDSRGVVWVGTSNGLSAFNGSKWFSLKKIEDSETGKLRNIGRVKVFFEDSKRNLWVGTTEGLFVFDGKQWTSFIKDDEDRFIPKKFMEDRQGRIWITSEYIQQINATVQMTFALTNGMLQLYNGVRWIDFNHIIGGTSVIVSGYSFDYFTGFFQDDKGNIWLSSMEGLFEFTGSSWKTYDEEELKSEKVLFVLDDDNGNVWAAMDNGIALYNGEEWKLFTKKDGLPGSRVNQLQFDNDGRLWAFTFSNLKFAGLGMFDDGKWKPYTKKNLNLKDEVEKLVLNGDELIAFTVKGLAVYREGEWHGYGKKDGLQDKQFSMIQSNRHGIWLAGESSFYQLEKDQWTLLFQPAGKWEVNVIFVENPESIWLGTEKDGVYRYSHKQWEHLTAESGLADNRISDIFKDKKGGIWMVSKSGVTRVVNE